MEKLKAATLFVDLTRLVRARDNKTPTGIERVDIAFINHLRGHAAYKVHFVENARGTLDLVPKDRAEQIINALSSRWSRVDACDDSDRLRLSVSDPEESEAEKLDRLISSEGNARTITRREIADFVAMSREQRANYVGSAGDYRQYFAFSPLIMRYLPEFAMKTILWLVVNVPHYLYVILLFEKLTARGVRAYKRITRTRKARAVGPGLQAVVASGRKQDRFYVSFSHSVLESREALRVVCDEHGIRIIQYIHDILPIEYPEYFRPGERRNHLEMLAILSENEACLICNSAATQRKLLEGGCGHGAVPDPVLGPHVVHIGCRALTAHASANRHTPAGFIPDGPYFVTIGTIEGRKNHLLLLHIWRRLAVELENPPKLVVVGKRGWRNGSVLDLLNDSEALSGVVVERNGMGDEEMDALLCRSRALLFPSFAEGWGMPAVEAMAMGVPVVCSDVPELREATQGIADYIDPLDGLGWMEAVVDYADDASQRRAAAAERLTRYEVPLWSDAFEAFDAIIASMHHKEEVRKGVSAPSIP